MQTAGFVLRASSFEFVQLRLRLRLRPESGVKIRVCEAGILHACCHPTVHRYIATRP